MTAGPPIPEDELPEARIKRRYFPAIWLIPIIAFLITAYLGVRSYAERGALVEISFRTAEGINMGQTAMKYKSVTLGTVENIELKKDLSGVVVSVRMNGHTDHLLTDHARFWLEKPRLTSTNISDIVSGTYIQIDPGAPGGAYQTKFVGLETQPALLADEPGTAYVLKTDQLGSVTAGTPVYYRDLNVGKVLECDIGNGFEPVSIIILVREPYDKFVKASTRFWNASGVTVKVGAGGLHVELQSLQSIFSGGVAFYTPPDSIDDAQADARTVFQLYDRRGLANSATYGTRVSFVTYLQSSVKDLAVGSPVQIFGIQVGEVTDVRLVLNPQSTAANVRVTFNLEPARAFGANLTSDADAAKIMRKMVKSGMRVRLESSDLLVGQEILSLEFMPRSEAAEIVKEGDSLVLPGQGGGIDALSDSLGDVAQKLNQIPFEKIGRNLDRLIASADQTIESAEMRQAIHSLAVTLANAEEISRSANKNLTPALQKLPDMSAQLQSAIVRANDFMGAMNNGYGESSDFQRNATRTLEQVNDAARSIRLLADFLERHPEALIEGKSTGKGAQ